MKVLQVIPNLYPGGAERFVTEITNALNLKEGIECDVLTLNSISDKDTLYSTIDKCNSRVFCLNNNTTSKLLFFYKIYKFIKRGNYNVIHCHVGAIKFILLATFFLPKVKFVATIHSEARREAGRGFEKYARKLMFKFNLCTPVTISKQSQISFDEFYNRSSIMIPNGVSDYKGKPDISIKKSENEFLFIHAASCQPVKNQKLLFSAFTKLKSKYRNIKLIWFGNVNVYKELFNELSSSYIKDGIEYGGVHNDIRSIFLIADAICLSSNMEGLPMTIIEAFSVGTPAICTPVGGCCNIIQNGYNGFLSDSISEEDYYKALEKFILLSFDERNKMRKNALETFATYRIDNTASKYIEVYNS